MSAPFEIVCAPYECWYAAIGATFPDVDEVPDDSDWTLIGTSGDKNYTDAGVTVTHGQTNSTFVPAGSTTPRKVWRTGETLMVAFTMADVSPEQYAWLINNATVTTTAAATGTAGTKHFELMRGVQVATMAVLVRGISSVDEALTAQYEIPCAYDNGNPAPVYAKTGPAELAIELNALELTAGVFGTLRVQTAAHT